MDQSTVNKLQHQYWVTKQTVYRKLGKKEDDCIIASDSELDAKLELFKSIHQTSCAMNKLLDRFQERLCVLAQEQNAMGRFLKEHGRADKSPAGKMMIQMGKSLIYCSQQEIALRPPLLRLYQEVETFRNQAINDTCGTTQSMEKYRTEYRASLNWMKKISQELDPDTNKQMEKFRKVQSHVKNSKSQFDRLKLACLQKIDLLAAARCNMFSHALIQYLQAMSKTTAKNAKIFNTLAITFKGHQYFEFSVVKELKEPSRKLAEESGSQPASEDLLFDFNDELKMKEEAKSSEEKGACDEPAKEKPEPDTTTADLVDITNASEVLENLLGPMDFSPETEKAQDALDLGLDLLNSLESAKNSTPGSGLSSLIGKSQKPDSVKDKSVDDLMGIFSSPELDGLTLETDNSDTAALLDEILNATKPISQAGQITTLLGETSNQSISSEQTFQGKTAGENKNPTTSSFMPSQLLDLQGFQLIPADSSDLLSFNSSVTNPEKKEQSTNDNSTKNWYDIFADLDPLGNPDAVSEKEKTSKEENRYC